MTVKNAMHTVTLSANTSWYLYNFRASTIRRLRADGYRVVCLSPEDDYTLRLTAELGCDWRPLTMDNHGTNPLRDMALVLQFWRQYRRLRPVAALHFTIKNNVYGTWAARAAGVPAINNVSGLGTAFIRPGLVSAVARLLYKTSQPLAHRVFCQNVKDRELLKGSRLVPADRLELLHGSGVDLQRFNPALRIPQSGEFRFLYAGRMLADKGLNELVEAIIALKADGLQCGLWLCGFAGVENISSISSDQLSRWGSLPGIEWLGPSNTMETIYSRVDCVVLPSYREGMPRTLLEASAMGLPVVATDVPGCRDIVENGVNGLLCEVKSATSLAAALRRMLSMSSAERLQMGKEGRARVERKFDEQGVVDATLRAVRSAQSAQASPRRRR